MYVHYALYNNLESPLYWDSYSSLADLAKGIGNGPHERVLIEAFPAGDRIGTCFALGEYVRRRGRLGRVNVTGQSHLLPMFLETR